MTNYNILTLLNPRLVKKDNNLYFVLLSCLGLQNDPKYSIFFKLNEKLISEYTGKEIYNMLKNINTSLNKTNISNILYNGFTNYKFGEDYFISESLYNYLKERSESETLEENYIKDNIYINDILEDSKDLILAIKNHDADLFNENFQFELPTNLAFIQRNINNTDIISLVIQKPYLLPDDTIEYEYSSIIDIFGLENNGVFVIGYSDESNVELNDNISFIIDRILEELNCVQEENGRYTIDIYKYVDYENSNLLSIDNNPIKDYIFEDFIIDNNFNVNTVYYNIVSNTSIDYYYMLQKALNKYFTIEELNYLYVTFFNIISEYTTISDFSYPNNIYKYVVDFYKNYSNDPGLNAINIILGSTYTTTILNTSLYNCSCNNSSTGGSTCLSGGSSNTNGIISETDGSGNISTMTCADKYKYAMEQYLIDMLGDINFYCDWMWTDANTNNDLDIINGIKSDLVPNDALIDLLIKLLTEFLDLGYDLSPNTGSTSKCGCRTSGCSNLNNSNGLNESINGINNNSSHCANCNIIENYIQVLKWVKEGNIEENKNKIMIYGKQFAHLLPGLIFN